MRSLKPFSERIMAQGPEQETAEILTRIAPMNRISALGPRSATMSYFGGTIEIHSDISICFQLDAWEKWRAGEDSNPRPLDS